MRRTYSEQLKLTIIPDDLLELQAQVAQNRLGHRAHLFPDIVFTVDVGSGLARRFRTGQSHEI